MSCNVLCQSRLSSNLMAFTAFSSFLAITAFHCARCLGCLCCLHLLHCPPCLLCCCYLVAFRTSVQARLVWTSAFVFCALFPFVHLPKPKPKPRHVMQWASQPDPQPTSTKRPAKLFTVGSGILNLNRKAPCVCVWVGGWHTAPPGLVVPRANLTDYLPCPARLQQCGSRGP